MKIKYLISICLILLFLISIAGASASEDANQTENNDILSEGVSEDTIAVSNDENFLTANQAWYVNASAPEGGNGSQNSHYKDFKSVLENKTLKFEDSIYFAGEKTTPAAET